MFPPSNFWEEIWMGRVSEAVLPGSLCDLSGPRKFKSSNWSFVDHTQASNCKCKSGLPHHPTRVSSTQRTQPCQAAMLFAFRLCLGGMCHHDIQRSTDDTGRDDAALKVCQTIFLFLKNDTLLNLLTIHLTPLRGGGNCFEG